MRNNWFSLSIVVIFLLAIFIPFAGSILQEDRGLSYTEKRKLQQLPSLPKSSENITDYVSKFEEYYNDQFGFRDVFLKSYSQFKKLLGDHDISSAPGNIGTKNIIKGKEGWFFLNRKWDGDPFSDYRNIDLYSEGQLLRSVLLFAARAGWLKMQDIEYLFFFAPNKHTIYSEYLPDYITKEGDISSWDQLNDALRRYTDVHFVDLRQPLIKAKDEAVKYWRDNKEKAALYYKKDSHWNGAGADIAQFEVAKKIERLFPGRISPEKRKPTDFVMRRILGDITLIMGGKEKEAYGPMLLSGTCTSDTFRDYQQRHHVTLCEQGKLDAIIFNDSFFPPLKPYFTDYFHRVVYHWNWMQETVTEQMIRANKPDIVIEQRAERFLPFTPLADYNYFAPFWKKHWSKWKKNVFTFDPEKAGKGGYNDRGVMLQYRKETDDLEIEALDNDPMIQLPKIPVENDKLYLVRAIVESPYDTLFQLYYITKDKEARYTERNSQILSLKKGHNTIYIPLFSLDLSGEFRIDPGMKKGTYILKELKIKELDWVSLRE